MASTITDRLYGESSGVAVKAPCASVSNGAPLPLVGLGAVGAYTPLPGDRILVKDQADPTTNGIYNASTGVWQRSGDFNGQFDCVQGTLIVVNFPNAGGTMYQLTTANPVIGTTPLNFFLGGTISQALFNSFLADVTFNGAATDGHANAFFLRTAAYAGGTPGFVNSCLLVETDVTGVSAISDEWAFLALLNNFANGVGSENVAAYFQGNKYGTAATWGAVVEVIERNAVNNPVLGTVALEVDVSVNGTDNLVAGNRIGVDVVIRRFNPAGAAAAANWGYRIDTSDAGASVGFGYGFFPGSTAIVGFDTSHCTINSAAYMMAVGQPIIFDGPLAQTIKLFYDGTGLVYQAAGANDVRLAGAAVQINSGGAFAQVLGPRNTGWNPWTGILNNATVYDASTVTLVQLAQRVAALQNALTVHGLLGL